MPDAPSPYILVNGDRYPFTPGQTLEELAALLCPGSGTVVVELNEAVIPPEQRTHILIRPDDRLEFIHFVGGG